MKRLSKMTACLHDLANIIVKLDLSAGCLLSGAADHQLDVSRTAWPTCMHACVQWS